MAVSPKSDISPPSATLPRIRRPVKTFSSSILVCSGALAWSLAPLAGPCWDSAGPESAKEFSALVDSCTTFDSEPSLSALMAKNIVSDNSALVNCFTAADEPEP